MIMNVFAALGLVVALIFASSALVAAFGYLTYCRAESRFQQDKVTCRDARREIGARMSSLAHWFSEDVGAWKAIEIVGLEIQRTGDFNVDECRARWRQEARDIRKADEARAVA
jgi:hypothetical protein